jgi:hypothetical protein
VNVKTVTVGGPEGGEPLAWFLMSPQTFGLVPDRALAVRQSIEMPVAPKQDVAEQNPIQPKQRELEKIRHEQNIRHGMNL